LLEAKPPNHLATTVRPTQAGEVWSDDTEAPGLIAPADLQLGCNPVQIPAPSAGTVQAVDGCGSPAVEHVEDIASSVGCVQTIERVYRAVDTYGNESRCEVAVSITGGCTPAIDLQKLVAHGHDADCSEAAVAAGGPVVSLTGTNGTPITSHRLRAKDSTTRSQIGLG